MILYDGVECRNGAKDITADNTFMTLDWRPPVEGPDLENEGKGSREFNLDVSMLPGKISGAPFYNATGEETAQLEFCIGLSIDYNKVDGWNEAVEVRLTGVLWRVECSFVR